jgi:hypothetical protein
LPSDTLNITAYSYTTSKYSNTLPISLYQTSVGSSTPPQNTIASNSSTTTTASEPSNITSSSSSNNTISNSGTYGLYDISNGWQGEGYYIAPNLNNAMSGYLTTSSELQSFINQAKTTYSELF